MDSLTQEEVEGLQDTLNIMLQDLHEVIDKVLSKGLFVLDQGNDEFFLPSYVTVSE